jgi:hypothetical protein
VSRRKASGDIMSLFPFMSILVCLIGSLTLMITLLMATQANSDQSEETLARYHKYTELEADIAFAQSELASVEELIQDARHLQDQTQKALDEVAAIEKQQHNQLARVDASSDYAKMLAESNELRKRIADLEQDPEQLQQEIAKVEAEVARRKAGPEEAVVQIRPGGSGIDIEPTFVECTATGLVVHGAGEPVRIRAADIAQPGGEFFKLLEQVAGTPKGEIVFLVRPDGVGTYNTARGAARTLYTANGYAKNGKLPVPSQGNIDLNIFRKP